MITVETIGRIDDGRYMLDSAVTRHVNRPAQEPELSPGRRVRDAIRTLLE